MCSGACATIAMLIDLEYYFELKYDSFAKSTSSILDAAASAFEAYEYILLWYPLSALIPAPISPKDLLYYCHLCIILVTPEARTGLLVTPT